MKIELKDEEEIFDYSEDNDLMSVLIKYLEIAGIKIPFNTKRIHLNVLKNGEYNSTINYEIRIIRYGKLFTAEVYDSHSDIIDIEIAKNDRKRGRSRMYDVFVLVGSQWNSSKSKLRSIFSGYENEIEIILQQFGRNPKDFELLMNWSEKGEFREGKILLAIPFEENELNDKGEPTDKIPITYPWIDVNEESDEESEEFEQDIETEKKQPDKKEKDIEMYEDGLGEEEPEEEE